MSSHLKLGDEMVQDKGQALRQNDLRTVGVWLFAVEMVDAYLNNRRNTILQVSV